MARPRTPTEVLRLRGSFRRNPSRGLARAGEPVPKGEIGEPPATLSGPAATAWRYLSKIARPGSLGDADRAYLEIAAELLALKRELGVDAMSSAKLNRLETMLGKLGMRPRK